MIRGICSGTRYLSEIGYVHRVSTCLPLSVCLSVVSVCLLTVIQLDKIMMRLISSGMRYLSEMGYVHKVSICLSVCLLSVYLSLNKQ